MHVLNKLVSNRGVAGITSHEDLATLLRRNGEAVLLLKLRPELFLFLPFWTVLSLGALVWFWNKLLNRNY